MNALLLLAFVVCALQSYATPSPVARPAVDTRDASDKVVVAHFMVGNSNPYTVADWTNGTYLVPHDLLADN